MIPTAFIAHMASGDEGNAVGIGVNENSTMSAIHGAENGEPSIAPGVHLCVFAWL